MNALVTGGSGFLGRYVVEQLVARGDRVRALCRRPDVELAAMGVEVVCADMRHRESVVEACRGMDVVFHVAGVAGIGGAWRHYYENNILATRHVVEGCRAHGVGRLVYTSSPSVTFDGNSQEGIDESAPYPKRWLCHYSRSKALAEQHVLEANQRHGLKTCALRPHLIWGPRDRNLIPRLLQRARSGRLRRIGDGENLIDTIYVENAAAAHLAAADAMQNGSPVAGSVYFISQGEPVRCWTWIDQLLELAGLPPARKSISPRAAWIAGIGCEAFYWLLGLRGEPPLSRFMVAQMATSHYFDIGRARRDFGYAPAISQAEGMRRLAETDLSKTGAV